ncbi:asparaginase [Ampullimonas aquatilis]|uniref:asparaginase n=1 Tax=Ampullimonas aquatilis TaxID=1341549 RepID=UPI003C751557
MKSQNRDTSHLPKIHLITTGGTIAGQAIAPDASRYQAGILTAQALLAAIPQVANLAQIETTALCAIDSKDMTPVIWLELARQVKKLLANNEVDGIVITHGTDTLEETAFFLHLTIPHNKPVVLTAAMRPADALSTDGPRNLYQAIQLASDENAWHRGVMVVMNDGIHAARHIAKKRTTGIDAFSSGEYGLLGKIGLDQIDFFKGARTQSGLALAKFSKINLDALHDLPMVEIMLHYAGVASKMVNAYQNLGVAGLVMAGTGNGSLSADLANTVHEAIQHGLWVVRSSRTGNGKVERDTAEDDSKLGFICANDLSPFQARIVLMLALLVTQTETANPSPKTLKIVQQIFDQI